MLPRALATALLVSGVCDVYFAATGLNAAGVVGAVCVAIIASSVVTRGVVETWEGALSVILCIVVGTVLLLSAFPLPAVATLKAPKLIAMLSVRVTPPAKRS